MYRVDIFIFLNAFSLYFNMLKFVQSHSPVSVITIVIYTFCKQISCGLVFSFIKKQFLMLSILQALAGDCIQLRNANMPLCKYNNPHSRLRGCDNVQSLLCQKQRFCKKQVDQRCQILNTYFCEWFS